MGEADSGRYSTFGVCPAGPVRISLESAKELGDAMTVPITVSDKDLLALLGIVSDHREADPGDGLPRSLLEALMGQVPSDAVSFFGLDSGQQAIWFGQGVPDDDDDDDTDAFWAHYWDCLPCSYADRSGDARSVTTVSDFYSARQWHATGMYGDYLRPSGFEHELLMCIPVAPGRTARLLFLRGPGPDFSERDRALLALLRPHLQEAYLDAQLRRRGVPALTPRHQEILRLVAAGHTNAQISRRLGVSEATVRKHLENIYARLQVSSRTAAVTRAFAGQHVPALQPCVTAGTRRAPVIEGPAGRLTPVRRGSRAGLRGRELTGPVSLICAWLAHPSGCASAWAIPRPVCRAHGPLTIRRGCPSHSHLTGK
jgi:DNA-binding CsgD family transcriptional regulator